MKRLVKKLRKTHKNPLYILPYICMLSGNLKFSEIKTFLKLETYHLCLLWNVENLLNLSIMVGNFFILLSFSGHILVQSRRWYIILKYYIMSDYTLNWVGGSETRGTDFSKKTRGYQFFIFIAFSLKNLKTFPIFFL